MARAAGNDALPDLMARSFFAMRWGLLAVAVVLPPTLLIGGHIAAPHHAAPVSISGYYHTAMRNVFVGALVAIGVMSLLYRAFNRIENLLLNLAGVAAIGVALFPPAPDRGATDGRPPGYWEHNAFAIALFAAIAIVAIFFATDTVSLLPDAAARRRFRLVYRLLGLAMLALPAAAGIGLAAGWGTIFWIESAALYAFAGYWIAKTIEYRVTSAERQAVRGALWPDR